MTAPQPRSRLRIGVGAAIVVVLVALGCGVLFSAVAPRGSSTTVAAPTATRSPGFSLQPSATPSADIYVHIVGEVRKPGLYELPSGSRAVDVVAAAGGFATKADQTSLNLARLVSDGEQIIVPKEGAAPAVASVPGSTAAAVGGKVNLNTADATALETLPRIGPAMAQRILDWRTKNGPFTSVDDLQNITGIGDKTFDALKELVTV